MPTPRLRPAPALGLLLWTSCLFAGCPLLKAEVRTLTDRQGRSIKADVIAVDGDQAKIRRDDGQTFNVPLSSLGDADQKALKEWAEKQALLIPAGAIELMLSRGKFSSKKQDGDGILTTEEEWGYSITLNNRIGKTVGDVRAEYILFVKTDAEPGKDSTPLPLKRREGKNTVGSLAPHTGTAFRTEGITIYKQQLKPGFIWTKTGTNAAIRDTLYGVWIRIYAGDQIVAENCNPESLTKTETWTGRSR